MAGAIKGITALYDTINDITEYEIYLLIVFIAQYLYAKFAKYGEPVGSKFKVLAYTVRDNIDDYLWSKFAYDIIIARNNICHYFGCSNGMDKIEVVSKDKEKLKEFIEYLDICGKDSKEDGESYSTLDGGSDMSDSGSHDRDSSSPSDSVYTPTLIGIDESDPIADLVRAVSIHYE